MLMYVYRL